jgi:hypothetical protein
VHTGRSCGERRWTGPDRQRVGRRLNGRSDEDGSHASFGDCRSAVRTVSPHLRGASPLLAFPAHRMLSQAACCGFARAAVPCASRRGAVRRFPRLAAERLPQQAPPGTRRILIPMRSVRQSVRSAHHRRYTPAFRVRGPRAIAASHTAVRTKYEGLKNHALLKINITYNIKTKRRWTSKIIFILSNFHIDTTNDGHSACQWTHKWL